MLIYCDIDNTVQIFREIPFFTHKMALKQQWNGWKKHTMKNDMRGEVTYLFLLLCSVLARRMSLLQTATNISSKIEMSVVWNVLLIIASLG